jgi:hypothetical protein
MSDAQLDQEMRKMPPPSSNGTIRDANDAYMVAAQQYISARQNLNAVRGKGAREDIAARRNAEVEQAINDGADITDEMIASFDDHGKTPPPNTPAVPAAAAATPDGPNNQLAETLLSNADAQAKGETLHDLPRGAEGVPSDPNFQLANRSGSWLRRRRHTRIIFRTAAGA